MSIEALYAAIRTGLAQGEKPVALAQRLGCHRKTVYKQLNRQTGPKVHAGAAGAPLWQCDQCGLLVRQGMPYGEPEPIECPICRGDLWPPVPSVILKARLDALSARLLAEFRAENARCPTSAR